MVNQHRSFFDQAIIMWIAVVIVVVLILLYFGQYLAGAVVAVGAGAALVGPIVMRGGWECINMSRPYGARCVDNGSGPPRADCERKCLGPREYLKQADIGKAAATIIKFTYDSGWNFPVPRVFLQQLATDPEMQARYYAVPRSALRIGNVIESAEEFAQYLRETLGVAQTKMVHGDEPATIGSEPLQYFNIGANIAGMDHANVVIANNTTRRIIHIEPNFGAGADPVWTANTSEMQRMFAPFIAAGYTFETSSACPVGLQSLSDLGGICAVWSKFLGIWAAQNPSRTLDEIFQYAIGINYSADVLVKVYIFYLTCRILNVTYSSERASIMFEYHSPIIEVCDGITAQIASMKQELQQLVRPTFDDLRMGVMETILGIARGRTQYKLEEMLNLASLRGSESFWLNLLPKFVDRPMWINYLDMLEYFGPEALRDAPPLPLEDNRIFLYCIANRNGVRPSITDSIVNEMDESNNEVTYWGALRAYSSYKYPNKTFKQIVYDA